VLIAMAKPGRNDPCPCGSGNKYKKCCLTKDDAVERHGLAEAEFRRAERVAARHPEMMREIQTAIAARLGMSEGDFQRYDELMDASNAAVELVHAGKLGEAEVAARDLLLRYPDEHDGWDRLGMVHAARGENKQAADCYRKVLDIIRRRPGDYDAAFDEKFINLIAKLDPPAAA
jgi:tetratricopeptide (TPR) repeat protein